MLFQASISLCTSSAGRVTCEGVGSEGFGGDGVGDGGGAGDGGGVKITTGGS